MADRGADRRDRTRLAEGFERDPEGVRNPGKTIDGAAGVASLGRNAGAVAI